MKEPCRSCPEKGKDFGGCRCQAYLVTGEAVNADPVCDKSPHRALIDETIEQAERSATVVEGKRMLFYRDDKTSRELARRKAPA